MPVGGSRHYAGGGLGQEGIWACPSCGEDNAGPIAQGCTQCGAGRPGRHVGTEAPPPPPPRPQAPPETPPETPPTPPEPEARQGDLATFWAARHPDVTIEDAYRAGYLDGVHAARQAQERRPPVVEAKVARTIVAALGYFADQVLRTAPPEVESGEWCSLDEVRILIERLTTTGEVGP